MSKFNIVDGLQAWVIEDLVPVNVETEDLKKLGRQKFEWTSKFVVCVNPTGIEDVKDIETAAATFIQEKLSKPKDPKTRRYRKVNVALLNKEV